MDSRITAEAYIVAYLRAVDRAWAHYAEDAEKVSFEKFELRGWVYSNPKAGNYYCTPAN
jgi:hypothetical protein